MESTISTKTKWRFWRWRRRQKNESTKESSFAPDIRRSEQKSAFFERIELASALLVVCSILIEDWDILHMAAHPTSKDGIKALGGIGVAVFIALEILFSQLSKKHDGIVRNWQARRIAELNLEAQKERHARVKVQSFLAGRDFTPEQSRFMKENLQQFKGQTAFIVNGMGDGEPARFSQHLWAVMVMCQWIVPVPRSDLRPKAIVPMPGMQIFATLDDKTSATAKALAGVLREVGHEVFLYNRDSHPTMFNAEPNWQASFWPPEYFLPNDPRILIVVNDTPRPPRPDVENP